MRRVIAWWSGGVTSAVACKLCLELFGPDEVEIIGIDTRNEDEDTYRFKADCEAWYDKPISMITNPHFNSIEEVWIKYLSLNVANGAICSSQLKSRVRQKWQQTNDYTYQAFGFDIEEGKRARAMAANHPDAKPIFPLLMYGLTKKECIKIVEAAGLQVPRMYRLGFHNNNCFRTGCVQGGTGYWQKMGREFSDKFDRMAAMEHRLTDLKGKPVTMLRDRSAESYAPLFLKPHPAYPLIKNISMVQGREVKPLVECNGFCGIDDLLPVNPTQYELNLPED